MKQLTNLLALLLLASSFIVFTNCGGDDDGKKKTEEEIQLDKLVGTWNVSTVTYNGTDTRQADFTGAKLIITSNKQFNFDPAAQLSGSPFPSTVAWKFGSPVSTQITRLDSGLPGLGLDDVTLTYTVTDNALTITIDDYAGENFDVARVASAAGDWVFTFTK